MKTNVRIKSYRAPHNLVVIECQGHFISIANDIIIVILADGHTVSNAPDLFRPLKLSGTGPGECWGGGPPGSQIIICQVITTYVAKSLQTTSLIEVSSPHVQKHILRYNSLHHHSPKAQESNSQRQRRAWAEVSESKHGSKPRSVIFVPKWARALPKAVSSVLRSNNTSPHPDRWPTCFARKRCQHAAGVLGKLSNVRIRYSLAG